MGNNGAFAIDSATGEITVVNTSLLNSASLTILATDDSPVPMSASAKVTVNVNHPPVVHDQVFTVQSSAAAGTPVGMVTATDPDSGQALTYSITAGNNGAFAINPSTGAITVADTSLLSALPSLQTTLTVRVADNSSVQGSSSLFVTINQNSAPVISDQTFLVPDTVTQGLAFGTVNAFDLDVARGQKLSYSITAGNSNGAFAINPATGVISIADLDAFNALGYSNVLTVQVQDDSPTLESATATVTIVRNRVPEIAAQTFGVLANVPNFAKGVVIFLSRSLLRSKVPLNDGFAVIAVAV